MKTFVLLLGVALVACADSLVVPVTPSIPVRVNVSCPTNLILNGEGLVYLVNKAQANGGSTPISVNGLLHVHATPTNGTVLIK